MHRFLFIIVVIQIAGAVPTDLSEIDCDGAEMVTPSPSGEPPFTTVRVPLRDGVKVAIDYFLPPSPGSFPTILEITPYGRAVNKPNFRNEASYWTNHSYAFAIGDVRGTGDSESDFVFISQEGEDSYDVIEWIARQPWSNGRVAMRGASYTGENQWAAAREQPPHLSCISPAATPARPMNEVPYENGAFSLFWALSWIGGALNVPRQPSVGVPHPNPKTWLSYRPLRTLDVYATGRELSLYRNFIDRPIYDDFWRSVDFLPEDFRKIQIPTLAFTGWFDSTLKGTVEHFREVQKSSPRRGDHFLIIGPYMHSNAVDGGYDYLTDQPILTIGETTISEDGLLPARDMTRAYYDWCLKDQQRPDYAPVKMFITGSNRWMTRAVFPPPESQVQSLYLSGQGHANSIQGDGQLQWELQLTRMVDRYQYDPANPVFINMTEKPYDLPVDLRSILDRDDVLVYTTEVLTKPLTVIGDLTFELYVSSTGHDTDFIVQLMEVMPDGRSIKLGSRVATQLRLRYREGYDKQVMMEPGTIYPIEMELGPMGHTFLPGHRIRLAIMSSLFPWYNANLNTGNPIATDMHRGIIANQTVFHSSNNQPSRIRLMVVENPRFD